MSYKAALHLIDMAKAGDLLSDPFVRNLIRDAAFDGDPDIVKEAESYIAYRAIDRMMSRYEIGKFYRP